MGNIISAIVSGLNSLVSAIANVFIAIFSGIGRVLVAIWQFVTCGACSRGGRRGGRGTV